MDMYNVDKFLSVVSIMYNSSLKQVGHKMLPTHSAISSVDDMNIMLWHYETS